jgi:hypothetical protein
VALEIADSLVMGRCPVYENNIIEPAGVALAE